MDKGEFEKLLQRYQTGECTPDEIRAIEHVFATRAAEFGDISDVEMREFERSWHEASHKITHPVKRIKVVRLLPYAAAACFGIAIFAGIRHFANIEPKAAVTVLADIEPGKSQAYLTLGDGRTIALEQASAGKLADQGAATVSKTSAGLVQYHAVSVSGKTQINTISTSRGGHYQIVLADGTKVWLNAASTLTFPATFDSKTREVNIDGEAYFEVAKNAAQPFIVKSGGRRVEVLGTHFNVNAYPDENEMRTTLLEGSVRVSAGAAAQKLVPGQQAVVKNNSIKVQEADTEGAVAWKEGVLRYQELDVKTILRQASRMYDITVEYRGEISMEPLTVTVSASAPLSRLLTTLKKLGVNFEMESSPKGKLLIVTGK